MEHVHHLRACYELLKKNWGSLVHSSPSYLTYCTLKMFTFEPKPLMNPSNLDAKANGSHVSVTVTSHMRLKQLNVVGRTCSFTKSAPNFGVDPYLCILLCVHTWRQVKNE
jgi:hypothetical protein